MTAALDALRAARTCRITTTGRRSGDPHVVSVWFALDGRTFYAGSRHGTDGDWFRNAVAAGRASVEVRRFSLDGAARAVTDEAEQQRALDVLCEKYASAAAVVRAWRAAPPVLVAIDLGAPEGSDTFRR